MLSAMQEEIFWQKRQAKLKQMSGLKASDQSLEDSSKHRDQENICTIASDAPLQTDWKAGVIQHVLLHCSYLTCHQGVSRTEQL